jgi:hypothetical protein
MQMTIDTKEDFLDLKAVFISTEPVSFIEVQNN